MVSITAMYCVVINTHYEVIGLKMVCKNYCVNSKTAIELFFDAPKKELQ